MVLTYHFSKCPNCDLIMVIHICEGKFSNRTCARPGMMNVIACVNFLQKVMKGIKQMLSVATVKASLLLRCGDVELNPGPVGKKHHIMIEWLEN